MFRKYLDSVQTKREKYFRITEFVDFLLTYSHINIKDSVYESEKNMWEYFYKVAITQRKGVCQDYTNVFAHLCEQNNLECQVVSGFGKGVTTSIKRNVNI
jgi:transglutaminase-like putative cysteine protease